MSGSVVRPGQPPLRPMDVGEILDQSFKLFFRSWKPLLAVGLISAIPGILSSGLTQNMAAVDPSDPSANYIFQAMARMESGDFGGLMLIGGIYLVVALALVFIYPVVQGAIIVICSRSVLGARVTLGEAIRAGATRYLPLLGTYLLVSLVMLGSLVLLFGSAYLLGRTAAGVPIMGLLFILGFLVMIPLLLVLTVFLVFSGHAVVVEHVGGGLPAIRRSFQLASGLFWRLLGLGLLFTVLTMVAGAAIGLVTVLPLTIVQLTSGPNPFFGWLTAILSGAGSAVTMPFTFVGLTLAYFDVRMRKEGYDLELLASATTGPEEA